MTIDEHGQSKIEFEDKVEKDDDRVDVEIELDLDTIQWLENEARERNITIDELVNRILEQYVAKQKT